ncbi:MAG: DUF4184 family protein [Steroidobacteraceae bacterium]
MPFTISHVAAVLPLHRPLTRARVFTAAVIGSMVPDFGLMVPGFLARVETHSIPSLITFCLPIGLLAYWLTMLLVRPAVIEVAPNGAYARLREHAPASIRQPAAWLGAAAALMLGAITHLVWDAFTHENARGVRMFPILTDYGPEMAGHSARLYRWLQYGSSIGGLAIVVWALVLWLHHAPPPSERPSRPLAPTERSLWLCAYLVLPVAAVLWSIAHPPPGTGSALSNGIALGWVAVAGMRGAIISALLISALIRLRVVA